MIGVFDSGHGGLTILRALVARFPSQGFIYLGDHAHVPYGDRDSKEIIALTSAGAEALFARGCRLVVLGCNTATAVAARHLQQNWLPHSRWSGHHNVLGIVAPTVEAATQTPWAVTAPQYPQKNNTDCIAVFGTTRTIQSGVYSEEIRKRCPKVTLVEQACAGLAGAIESRADERHLNELIEKSVSSANAKLSGRTPNQVILGCTHFPLVEHLFRRHLPAETRILSQPDSVADSLEDYLGRHRTYVGQAGQGDTILLTTGNSETTNALARVFWPEAPPFTQLTL